MPRMKTESFQVADWTWLGSTHGIRNARTLPLDISAFTKATHYPDGYLKDGLPLAAGTDGRAVPYDAAGADSTGVLIGFLHTPQSTDGVEDLNVPVLDHGRIKTAKLPVESFTKPAPDKDATTCVYI